MLSKIKKKINNLKKNFYVINYKNIENSLAINRSLVDSIKTRADTRLPGYRGEEGRNICLYTFVMGKTDKAKILSLDKSDFGFCVELPIKAKRNNFKLINFTQQ